MVKPWFSHLSLAIANLKHLSKCLNLAIYIGNSVNMCSGMPVFADRRRDGRLRSPSVLIDVVGGVIALLAISTDDDVDEIVIKKVKVVVKERKKKKMQKILRS